MSEHRGHARRAVEQIVRFALGLGALGCGGAPPAGQDVVSAVTIHGGDLAADPALEKGLATHDSNVFDGDVLQKDLERVLRFYRAGGYYAATIRAARVVREGPHRVRVEIDVDPGDPVRVGALDIEGLDELPRGVRDEAFRAVSLRTGRPLVEQTLHEDAARIKAVITGAGYAFGKVSERAEVSVARRRARVTYSAEPGPPAVYGEVSIEGLGPLDAEVVRATLAIQQGEPYSADDIDAAKRRVFNLGVFSAVEIKPDLRHPENPAVPLRVSVTPGATHSVHLGAVFEQDSVLARAGLRAGWESRNFLGGLRRFTVNVTPSLIFYPLATPDVPLKTLPSVTSTFRLEQPAFLEARTTGFVETDLSAYPALYSDFHPGDNIIGFEEVKGSVGVERPFANEKLKVRPSYNAQLSFPFMYLGEKPAGLDTLLVLYPELVAQADFRDNPLDPRSGAFFRASLQVAGYIGGDADDVRIEPEMRLYTKLGKSVALGYRLEVGLLLPRRCNGHPSHGCYGDSLEHGSAANATDPAVIRDQQILLFRGFYSGGATSNRGYNYREVGPHGTLGFLVPSNTNCAVNPPPDSCIQPLGGLTLWEQSLELRLILSELVGLAFFLDASDVTREAVTFRLNFPHLAAGTGFRLRTPVGAARFDLGFRIPYMQEVGKPHLPPTEGAPGTFLGVPLAFHFGLGEAF
ncbi:MAG TPA: POTRA domain-containing protein [Polyangiaceae bacterium]|nr:POTRA domain-containing protein [Polyangiaceae bacterium]